MIPRRDVPCMLTWYPVTLANASLSLRQGDVALGKCSSTPGDPQHLQYIVSGLLADKAISNIRLHDLLMSGFRRSRGFLPFKNFHF